MENKRKLTKKEQQALELYLGITDFSNFFVTNNGTGVNDKNSNIHGEKIVRNTADNQMITCCTLLWLARYDSKRNNSLKGVFNKKELEYSKNIYVSSQNLTKDHLTHLRRESTSLRNFRFHSDHLCLGLFREAVADLEIFDSEISNSLVLEMGSSGFKSPKLAEKVVVVPVLRAGLAMLSPAIQSLPKSKVGVVGLERDEQTAKAKEYYFKMPEIDKDSVVIITDPMLATGGTLIQVMRNMKKMKIKPKEIRIVCVVAAPEGISAINNEFGNIKIFAAAVDSHLNKNSYIVPGLGDYGDRYFGT